MEFTKASIELSDGELISNVLKIINTGNKEQTFYLDINYPANWRGFNKYDKAHIVAARDTLFIPVRMIPLTNKEGNMKFMISAIMQNEDGNVLSYAYFMAQTKKVSKWKLDILPTERIYFLNGENEAEFKAKITNEGNDKQDFLFTLYNERPNVLVTDTSGKILKNKGKTFNLKPEEDTTFRYNVKLTTSARNFRRIDFENHRPKTEQDEKMFFLYANAVNPDNRLETNSLHKLGKRVGFYKLTNYKTVNPYGNTVAPLIVDAEVYNLMMRQSNPLLNLFGRGNTMLSNGANLTYFGQIGLNSNYFNELIWQEPFFFVGYNDQKLDIRLGDQGMNFVGGGFPVQGRGLYAGYNLTQRHKIGAFGFTSRPIFDAAIQNSYGATYEYTGSSNLIWRNFYVHQDQLLNNRSSDVVASNISLRVAKNHRIFFAGSASRNVDTNEPEQTERLGWLARGGYTGSMLNHKLSASADLFFTDRSYALLNQENFGGNVNLNYRLENGRALRYQGIYNEFNRFDFDNTTKLSRIAVSNHQLFYSIPKSNGFFQPFAYYNMNDFFNNIVHGRGLGLMYSQFKLENNLRVAANIRGGFNNLVTDPELPEYFTAQFFSLLQYKVYSFNAIYNYGPVNNLDQIYLQRFNRNPQTLLLSARQQYLFKGERFLIQNTLNYSLLSHINNHNIGYFPEVFYYSLTGFRFKVAMGYNLSIRNSAKILRELYDVRNLNDDYSLTINQGVIFNVGVRKEFGIKLKKDDKFYHNLEFISFLDVNGNGIHDGGEELLENVIISFHSLEDNSINEVISNQYGMAGFINLPKGIYKTKVFSLVNLNGWYSRFPENFETVQNEFVYVPFVRGTKLHGGIFLNRDRMAVDADQELDLSRIRITAFSETGEVFETITNSKGAYQFYLPNGIYTISFNESVLGNRFRLAQNDIQVELNESSEGLYVPFHIIERTRTVNKKRFGAAANDSTSSTNTGPRPVFQNNTNTQTASTKAQEEAKRLAEEREAKRLEEQNNRANQTASSNQISAANTAAQTNANNATNNQIPAANTNPNTPTPNQQTNGINQTNSRTQADLFKELEGAVNQLIEQRTGAPAPTIPSSAGAAQSIQNQNAMQALEQAVDNLIDNNPNLAPAKDYSGEFGNMERLADELIRSGNILSDQGVVQGNPSVNNRENTEVKVYDQQTSPSTVSTLTQGSTKSNISTSAEPTNSSESAKNETLKEGIDNTNKTGLPQTNDVVTNRALQKDENSTSFSDENEKSNEMLSKKEEKSNTLKTRATNTAILERLSENELTEGEEPANIKIARAAKAQDEAENRGNLRKEMIAAEVDFSGLPENFDPALVKFNVQTGIFAQEIPQRVHEKFIAIGFKARKTPDGKTRYVAGNLESLEQAREFRDKLRQFGFNDAFVVGSYGEKVHLSAGQALDLKSK